MDEDDCSKRAKTGGSRRDRDGRGLSSSAAPTVGFGRGKIAAPKVSSTPGDGLGRGRGRTTTISSNTRAGIGKGSSATARAATGAAREDAEDDPTSVAGTIRSIEDPWTHGTPKGAGFTCNYCTYVSKGGGKTRLRLHLAKLQGDCSPCSRVPPTVCEVMKQEVLRLRKRSRDNKEHKLMVEKTLMESEKQRVRETVFEDADLRRATRESLKDSNLQKGNATQKQATIHSMFQQTSTSKGPFDVDLARSKIPTQLRVDSMFNRDIKDQIGRALAKWFHANDIPGRKANCPYFRSAMKLIQEHGEGVPLPTGRDIDGVYLDTNYEDMLKHASNFKEEWEQYGVTVMCDSWTGPSRMCLVNFMIWCNGTMLFHKSVNATGRIQNSQYLYDEIKKVVVDEIGDKHVVQIVTDNALNYKKACQKLTSEYRHISWQPCAAHTINLMLKEIVAFDDVAEVVDQAKRICRFFYNHNRLHAMMKEKIGGELIRWNATRFGTVFLFLQSFWDRKDRFREWMASSEWHESEWVGSPDFDFTYDCLIRRAWWEKIEKILKAVRPLYDVLRYADAEKMLVFLDFFPGLSMLVLNCKQYFQMTQFSWTK